MELFFIIQTIPAKNSKQNAQNDGHCQISCTNAELHYYDWGVHLEIEQQHGHYENIKHVPFIQVGGVFHTFAKEHVHGKLNVFEQREKNGKDEYDTGNQKISRLVEYLHRVKEIYFIIVEWYANEAVFCCHNGAHHTQNIEYDGP